MKVEKKKNQSSCSYSKGIQVYKSADLSWVIYINGGGCKMQAYKQQESNSLSRVIKLTTPLLVLS